MFMIIDQILDSVFVKSEAFYKLLFRHCLEWIHPVDNNPTEGADEANDSRLS